MEKLELKLKVDKTEKKEVESEKGSFEVFTTILKTEDDKTVTVKSPSDLGFKQGDSIEIKIHPVQKTLKEDYKIEKELEKIRDKK